MSTSSEGTFEKSSLLMLLDVAQEGTVDELLENFSSFITCPIIQEVPHEQVIMFRGRIYEGDNLDAWIASEMENGYESDVIRDPTTNERVHYTDETRRTNYHRSLPRSDLKEFLMNRIQDLEADYIDYFLPDSHSDIINLTDLVTHIQDMINERSFIIQQNNSNDNTNNNTQRRPNIHLPANNSQNYQQNAFHWQPSLDLEDDSILDSPVQPSQTETQQLNLPCFTTSRAGGAITKYILEKAKEDGFENSLVHGK